MSYNILYALITAIVCLAGSGLSVFIFADSTIQLDRVVNDLKYSPQMNYFGSENKALMSLFGNDVVSQQQILPTSFYPIQIQSSPGSSASNQDSNTTELLDNDITDNGIDSRQESNGLGSSNSGSDQIVAKQGIIKCEGAALCVMGEVVKVINAKTLYVNIQNKVHKVELSMIALPVSEQAMRSSTIFTRDNCLGNNVLIDQDDGQQRDAFVAQVYCSPTKNLNSMLLDTGFVLLDISQCKASEFSGLNWAKSHGC